MADQNIYTYDGLEVSLPSGFRVLGQAPAGKRAGGRPESLHGAIPLQDEDLGEIGKDPIVQALEEKDFEVLKVVDIQPEPLATIMRSRDAGTNTATIHVDLRDEEDAVILLEQDELYLWQYPDNQESANSTRGAITTTKRLHFSFEVYAGGAETATKRSILGKIEEFGLKKIKAYILKFLAHKTVEIARGRLEQHVRQGLVRIAETSPGSWAPIEGFGDLLLQEGSTAKILLFVHGTFSSTLGAFGALGTTPWGQSFLEAALEQYSAILGFDHKTLGEDPLENARELLEKLKEPAGLALEIDIVTHSRGGLVVRSLIEKLLPEEGIPVKIGKVIFVGSTNAGTLLAEPGNWKDLIDLYTNLVAGTSRVISLISPQTAVAAMIIREIISNIGSFLQYVANDAVTAKELPGLAAMEPNGEFIKDINGNQPGQPGIDDSYYCIITSEFKPKLNGDHEPKELPQRLLALLAGGFMGQLMKEANDLVVNTSSMGAIDLSTGDFIKMRYDFGPNPQVYHTNYFTRPEVANALVRWLNLQPPSSTGKRSGGPALHNIVLPPPPTRPVKGLAIFPAIDTDILVASAHTAVRDLMKEVTKQAPSFVVLTRPFDGATLHYAFKPEELHNAAVSWGNIPAIDALGLHETGQSGVQHLSNTIKMPRRINTGGANSVVRDVVLDDGKPVGVIGENDLPDASLLAYIAGKAAGTAHEGIDRTLIRRTMPTFLTKKQEYRNYIADTILAIDEPGFITLDPVTCHIQAEMEAEVISKKKCTVTVTLSREQLEAAVTGISETKEFSADPLKELVINVIPKKNLTLAGDSDGRYEIDLGTMGNSIELVFDLLAGETGQGEVWILAKQGIPPLAKLVLKPQIVLSRSLLQDTLKDGKNVYPENPYPRPINMLRIEERKTPDGVAYTYSFFAQGLKVADSFTSKPITGDRAAYVMALYKKIEDRWISLAADQAAFLTELRAIGADLLTELMPKELQSILWEKRKEIDSIFVISREPFIPWELLHLKDPNVRGLPAEVLFLGQLGLVRWLEGAGSKGWPPDSIIIQPNGARYVIPKYPYAKLKLQGAEDEITFMETEFKATPVEPTSAEVGKIISQPGAFDLLHFACHGDADIKNIEDAAVLLQGRVEGANYIVDRFSATTAKQLGALGSGDNAPMVVLNACRVGQSGYKLTGVGGFADAFLTAGAGAFISSLWAVSDTAATVFSRSLYTHLKAGLPLSEATRKARDETRGGEATWLSYVVYGHPYLQLTVEP